MVRIDITPYVEQLRADLTDAAAAGGDTLSDAAQRLSTALDAAVRLALLEALSDAAAEITVELGDRAVEVRLQGRNPHFAVTGPASVPLVASPARDEGGDSDDDALTARITLRIGDGLKSRAEQAATQTRQSLNTWLVDAIREAVAQPSGASRRDRRPGQQLSGWVR